MELEQQKRTVEGLTLLIEEHLKIAGDFIDNKDVEANLQIVSYVWGAVKELDYFPKG